MIKLKLHWQILIAIIIGIIWAIVSPSTVKYISWMGDVFIRLLKMVIIPLILSSIISGVANVGGTGNLGRLGLKTISYYISTSLLAILTGLIAVNIIKPGIGADLGFVQKLEGMDAASGTIGQTLLRMIPTNIFSSMANGEMLAIIFFSILFGFYITQVENASKNFLLNFFNSTFEVMMKITFLIIRFTPLGVLGLVSALVAKQAGDFNALMNVFGRLGLYMLTVLIALIFHFSITLPLFVKVFGKSSPVKHIKAVSPALLTAFSTASSSATLPLTIDCVENNAGVSNKISSFTLPLGATINMDGTALYECVAVMFISQAYGIELSFAQQMIVVFTALLASIGAAGIPMAGLVMMSIVLSAVGLPLEGVGLILAVDQILDMCRTTVNVFSDTCGAVIIAKSEGETLKV